MHCSPSLFKGRNGNICYAKFIDLSIFNQPSQCSMSPQLSLITITEWTYRTQTRQSGLNEENADSQRKISIFQTHLVYYNRLDKQTSATGCRRANLQSKRIQPAGVIHKQSSVRRSSQAGHTMVLNKQQCAMSEEGVSWSNRKRAYKLSLLLFLALSPVLNRLSEEQNYTTGQPTTCVPCSSCRDITATLSRKNHSFFSSKSDETTLTRLTTIKSRKRNVRAALLNARRRPPRDAQTS